MTDAREIIARANYEHWNNIPACTDSKPWDVLAVKLPGQHADFLRKADAQLAALTAAGFRIVGPGEVDKETVERCAEVVDAEVAKHQGPFTSQPAYVAACTIRDALRALKEKQR